MTKTTWIITDETENVTSEFTYYHFGKKPKFPAWYMEENHVYSIEMLWNFKLIMNIETLFKCLTHFYLIK